MPARYIVAQGIGFSPGSVRYIPLLGFTPVAIAPTDDELTATVSDSGATQATVSSTGVTQATVTDNGSTQATVS